MLTSHLLPGDSSSLSWLFGVLLRTTGMGEEPVLRTECAGEPEQVYVVLFFLRKVGSFIHHPSPASFLKANPPKQ